MAVDRADLEYKAFTTGNDIVCRGDQLDEILSRKAIDRRPSKGFDGAKIDDRLAVAGESRSAARDALRKREKIRLEGYSILVLVDQSGSMVTRMPAVAGQLVGFLELVENWGGECALVGFTTVGWKGGKSRIAWSKSGRPTYPGRLCDLIYVLHSEFDDRATDLELLPFVLPDVLFENVDGEALLWGRERLLEQRAKKHVLLVVSDGAPVDDSTLLENGSEFLWRHLQKAIEQIEADPRIDLGGLGIDHRVEALYRNSSFVSDNDSVAEALVGLLPTLADK